MQQMAHFIEPEAAGLREPQDGHTLNSIGRVAALSTNPYRSRQDANLFPIPDCGYWKAAFRRQFRYRHSSTTHLLEVSFKS